MEFSLSDAEKSTLLTTARESVSAALEGRKALLQKPTPTLSLPCGAFVTIKKHGALRGCIGSMIGRMPLLETVRQMACSAAFEDPRFEAMEKDEISEVDFEISVLSPLEKIDDLLKIRVGVHGLYMMGMGHSGVLLPQVAVEWGWDRDTFLAQTCRKAGLPPDAYLSPNIEIYIFSAIVFSEE